VSVYEVAGESVHSDRRAGLRQVSALKEEDCSRWYPHPEWNISRGPDSSSSAEMERALSWNGLSLMLLQTTWLQVKLVSSPALCFKPKDHNIVFGVNYEITDIKSPQLDFRKIVPSCFPCWL